MQLSAYEKSHLDKVCMRADELDIISQDAQDQMRRDIMFLASLVKRICNETVSAQELHDAKFD